MWELAYMEMKTHERKTTLKQNVRIFDDCKYGALDVKYTFIYKVIRI